MMGVPLVDEGHRDGALNVFSDRTDVFDDDAVADGRHPGVLRHGRAGRRPALGARQPARRRGWPPTARSAPLSAS